MHVANQWSTNQWPEFLTELPKVLNLGPIWGFPVSTQLCRYSFDYELNFCNVTQNNFHIWGHIRQRWCHEMGKRGSSECLGDQEQPAYKNTRRKQNEIQKHTQRWGHDMEKGVNWVFGAAPKILLSRGGAVLKTHIVVGAFQNRQVVITYLRRTTSGFGIILTWTNGRWTCHDYPSWKRDWVQSQNDESYSLAELDGQQSHQLIWSWQIWMVNYLVNSYQGYKLRWMVGRWSETGGKATLVIHLTECNLNAMSCLVNNFNNLKAMKVIRWMVNHLINSSQG